MDTSAQPLKVGFVGWGRIAQSHWAAVQALGPCAELAGVTDVCSVARASAAEQTGVATFDTLGRMMSSVNLDVVCVLTPSGTHPSLCMEAMRAGAHAICEKPMATRWSDGLAMADCAQKVGRRLFVVKQNRFNPTVMRLKRAANEGRFGRMHMLCANVFWQRPQSYYDAAAWRGTEALDGGAIANQASHYVDLLQWLGGGVSDVFSTNATIGREIEMEDTALLSMRFDSGALGQLCVSMLTYPVNLEGSITVMGSHGTARISGTALNKVEVWQFDDQATDDVSVSTNNYETKSVYGSGHGPYYRSVWDELQGLNGSHGLTPDAREGLKSLGIIQAAYLSNSSRKNVSIRSVDLA